MKSKTYKKLKTLIREFRSIKEDGVVAGNFSAVNTGAVAGLHPPDTHPKQLMGNKIYKRKKRIK